MGPSAPSLFDQASHWLFSGITTRRRPRNLPQAKKEKQWKENGRSKGTTGDFDLELCDVSHDEAMRGSGIFGAHRGLTIRICRQSATGFVSHTENSCGIKTDGVVRRRTYKIAHPTEAKTR